MGLFGVIVGRLNDRFGHPLIQAAGVLSTIGAVSMLGRFVSGLIIDRRGSKTVMGICFLLLLGDLSGSYRSRSRL